MMKPLNWNGWENYGDWWQVSDTLNPKPNKKHIFASTVIGFQTHRDHFAISFSESEMQKKLQIFGNENLSDLDIEEQLNVRNNRDWTIKNARKKLRNEGVKNLVTVAYRPFDMRFAEYSDITMDYPRSELIKYVIGRKQIMLGIGRSGDAIPERPWELATVSDNPMDANMYSRGGVNVFFSYVFDGDKKSENLAPEFRDYLDTRYSHHYSPEEILGYIYAVLHAPTYRKKYAEFLRIDFPRIPFAGTNADFEALSNLGWELIEAHLMRELPKRGLADYHGKGENTVEHVRWSEEDQRISINKTQSFTPVPEEVWNFHIGGYQVIDKYLKSRKDRQLSLDEINHVGRICDALAFTIDQMAKIDTAYNRTFADS
jgi:predicted helicase